MLKTTYFTLLTLFFTTVLVAQDVKFKNKIVSIDQNEVLNYEQPFMSDNMTFFKLNSKEEILYLQYTNDPHSRNANMLYYTIAFVQQKVSFETQKFNQQGLKKVFKKMVKEGIVLPDGTIDVDAMERFKVKYEDNITKFLVR
ncbi:hypothetical protein [Myroides odoratus]|uniref:hypothetical protein n=1 Tax=Myroides odoratus TaxID=256 RepID=UPI00333FE00B